MWWHWGGEGGEINLISFPNTLYHHAMFYHRLFRQIFNHFLFPPSILHNQLFLYIIYIYIYTSIYDNITVPKLFDIKDVKSVKCVPYRHGHTQNL